MALLACGVLGWIYLNWLSVAVLTGLFLWQHTKVLLFAAPYATTDIFQALIKNSLADAYSAWYVKRLKEKTAFWYPDLFFLYILIASFIILQIYMIWSKNKAKIILACCSVPSLLMACLMITNLYTDTLMSLNMRPRGPQCGCLNTTVVQTALVDCQCYVPFHEGLVRLLAVDPANVTVAEYQQAGVSAEQAPSGNLTIIYQASSHNVDALNTWESPALTMEFVLVECSIFIVLTRLRPFMVYQKELFGSTGVSLFTTIISHHYYLLSECLDAFALFEEIFEHGDYFVDHWGLVYGVFIAASTGLVHIFYGSFPPTFTALKFKPGFVTLHSLLGKCTVLLFINTPLLVIRIYLVSLYGDEVKIGIVFLLFIVREVGMVVLGVIEVVYEFKTLKSG